MKKTTKLISLTSAMLMAFSSLAACGKPKIADNETTLEIYATDAGYGIQWLYELEKIFEAETDYDVEITYDTGVELARQKVQSGSSICTADLFFSLEDWETIAPSGVIEDMTDFMETTIDGEKLKDKFRPYSLEALDVEYEKFDYEPHYYTLPWAASATGIVYNAALFETKGWALPRTSNELVSLANTIKTAGYIPFCNETTTGYMSYIIAAMWAQYDGVDYYYDYLSPTSEDDWIKYSSSAETKGRLYASMVAEELYNKDAGLLNPMAQEDDYGRAQGRLISLQGAMAVNGDWFDNEMSLAISQGNAAGNNYKSGMMLTPVISCIVDKLDFWAEEYAEKDDPSYYTVIADPPITPLVPTFDAYLADLVDYVDGIKTEMPTITINGKTYTATESDVATIQEARGCYRSLGSGHTVVIPSFAKAKTAAFKFLELFYSERGAAIFVEETKGGLPAIQYDVTKWSGYANATKFQKDVFNMIEKGTAINFPAERYNGLPSMYSKFYLYSQSDKKNYLSAQAWYSTSCWSKQQFIDFMKSAGLM